MIGSPVRRFGAPDEIIDDMREATEMGDRMPLRPWHRYMAAPAGRGVWVSPDRIAWFMLTWKRRPIFQEISMRLILGIILGVFLTIGGAYISDSLRPASNPDGTVPKPMVNWDIVQEKFKSTSAAVQDGWTRLTGH